MKLSLLVLVCFSYSVMGQYGYVRLQNDSIKQGYLKHYHSVSTGEEGIEVWATKNDRKPGRVPLSQVHEYAIGKDTIRVLQSYEPFPDHSVFLGTVEAPLISRGKVELMSLVNTTGSGYQGLFFVLEDKKTRYIRAVPHSRQFLEVVRDFIPDRFLRDYSYLYGKMISYDEIPDMVSLYNSDMLINSKTVKRLDLRSIILDQLTVVIDNADEILGKSEAELVEQPKVILGKWNKLGEESLQDSNEIRKVLLYETYFAMMNLYVARKTGLVDAVAFMPDLPVTKKEVARFLSHAYHETGGHYVTVSKSTGVEIALTIGESGGIYYVLILAPLIRTGASDLSITPNLKANRRRVF